MRPTEEVQMPRKPRMISKGKAGEKVSDAKIASEQTKVKKEMAQVASDLRKAQAGLKKL